MKGDCNELGPAGSDGRVVVDGAPGRNGPDGLHGPLGTISEAVINQLREYILKDWGTSDYSPIMCQHSLAYPDPFLPPFSCCTSGMEEAVWLHKTSINMVPTAKQNVNSKPHVDS